MVYWDFLEVLYEKVEIFHIRISSLQGPSTFIYRDLLEEKSYETFKNGGEMMEKDYQRLQFLHFTHFHIT